MLEIAFMQVGSLFQDHRLKSCGGKFLGHDGARTATAYDHKIYLRLVCETDLHVWFLWNSRS